METTTPNPKISGIHHLTAIAASAAENLAFYETVLGLRLVKQTVNFDDPSIYHLYYGDTEGTPGTILTFFPWENLPRGRAGAGNGECDRCRHPGSRPAARKVFPGEEGEDRPRGSLGVAIV